MPTSLRQNCTTKFSDSGAPIFAIESFIEELDTNELPAKEIFLFKVKVLTDPKLDEFTRIASVTDLVTYRVTRDQAIQNQTFFYLAATFTLQYSDVTVANAAKLAIQDRVNTLVNDWITYSTAFSVTGTTVVPKVDSATFDAALNNYKTALETKTAATAAITALNTSMELAQKDLALANSTLTTTTKDYSDSYAIQVFLVTFSGAFPGFMATQGTFISNSNEFADASSEFEALVVDPAIIDVRRQSYRAKLTAYYNSAATTSQFGLAAQEYGSFAYTQPTNLSNAVTRLNEFVGAKKAAMTTAASSKQQAEAAVQTIQLQITLAEASVKAASIDVDNALAAVLAIDPTYTPT